MSKAPAAGSGARLISNSRWNLLSFIASLLINLITIPLAIRLIGLPTFGAAGLVVAVYAPFMLVGTVLSQVLIKELAPMFNGTAQRGSAMGSLFASALSLSLVASMAIMLGLTLVAEPLSRLLPDADLLSLDWRTCFLLAGIGWLAQQLALICQGCVAASQRYGLLALANALIALVSAALLLLACVQWPSAEGFLLGSGAGFVFALAAWSWLLRRHVPDLFPIVRPQRDHVQHMLGFGRVQGSAHFLGAIGNQIDRYMLGAVAPLGVVGQFNVAMRLQEVVHMGLLKITEVLLPHFAVTAAEAPERRADFFLRANWVVNVLGACALAPLIPLADSLITLWVGAPAAELGAPMLRTLALAGIAGCGINLYYYFALGTGQQGRLAGLTSAHALVTVLLTILAIATFGPVAAGVGYLMANLLRLVVGMWLTQVHFNGLLSLGALLGSVFLPLGVASAVGVALFKTGWVHPESWLSLTVSYVLIGLLALLASGVAATLSHAGRNTLAGGLSMLRQRFAQRG
jgi:O-antigen/teichoic acid export membrane protein